MIYLAINSTECLDFKQMMQTFVQTILQTQWSCRQTIQRKMRTHGIDISFEMLYILRHLSANRRINQQELAKITAKDKSSLSYLIKNMEKRDLLTREESTDDRRSKHITLSPKGMAMWTEIKQIIDEVYAQVEQEANLAQMQLCIDNMNDISEIIKSK